MKIQTLLNENVIITVIGYNKLTKETFTNIHKNVTAFRERNGYISIIYEDGEMLKSVNYIDGDNTEIKEIIIK